MALSSCCPLTKPCDVEQDVPQDNTLAELDVIDGDRTQMGRRWSEDDVVEFGGDVKCLAWTPRRSATPPGSTTQPERRHELPTGKAGAHD
jgi:hypothetical protein